MVRLDVFFGLLLPALHILDANPRHSRKAIGILAGVCRMERNLPLHGIDEVDQVTGPSRTEPSGTPPSIGMALRFALAAIGWPMSDVTITGLFDGTRS